MTYHERMDYSRTYQNLERNSADFENIDLKFISAVC